MHLFSVNNVRFIDVHWVKQQCQNVTETPLFLF
ncbi:Uncharacterised protein [Salmonella enterica]|uniref:Uncharacterized protein n=1 Tax=Salmonella enterica TaxID=28901 RepID=A0A379QF70_SALER|nr:Uncharacterised protein [Salmonella enterica]